MIGNAGVAIFDPVFPAVVPSLTDGSGGGDRASSVGPGMSVYCSSQGTHLCTGPLERAPIWRGTVRIRAVPGHRKQSSGNRRRMSRCVEGRDLEVCGRPLRFLTGPQKTPWLNSAVLDL